MRTSIYKWDAAFDVLHLQMMAWNHCNAILATPLKCTVVANVYGTCTAVRPRPVSYLSTSGSSWVLPNTPRGRTHTSHVDWRRTLKGCGWHHIRAYVIGNYTQAVIINAASHLYMEVLIYKWAVSFSTYGPLIYKRALSFTNEPHHL